MGNSQIKRNYTIEDLEQLLDNIPYEVWIKDEEGKHVYINKICAEKMNYKKDDLIGKTDYQFRPYEMAQKCVESDKMVLSKDYGVLTEEKSYMDGKEKNYEVCKVRLRRKNNKSYLGGIAKEVTIDKLLQNKIAESSVIYENEQLKRDKLNFEYKILDEIKNKLKSIEIAIYLFDKDSNSMKLYTKLSDFNDVLNSINVRENIKISKQYINDLIKNEKHIEFELNSGVEYRKIIHSIKFKENILGELHIYFNKGINLQYFEDEIINSSCMALGIIIENRQLSKEFNNELEKRKSMQKKLKLILDTGIDIYGIVSVKNNLLKWVNVSGKCKEILGWNIDEYNEKSIIEFIHPHDKVKFLRALIKINKYDEYKNHVCRVLCKNGEYKMVIWSCNYIKSEEKYIIVSRDLTKIKRVFQKEKSLENDVQLDTLKSDFFANMSHEFKTPLNIILTSVQVITNYLNNKKRINSDKITEYMSGIKQNAYRLLKLTNNVIDITKIDSGFYDLKLDNYNIVNIVDDLVLSVSDYMKKNKRSITFDTTEEEIILACDREKIERIILNLLSNSVKFTKKGGHIDISLDVNDNCNKAIIKVKNDGDSLKEKDSKKIFERFTQTDELFTRKNEGSGIGLALVKSLVELHNGKIYVNTSVKKGTEFNIELPIRKIRNNKTRFIIDKNLNSDLQRYVVEFSDIYNS